MPPPSPPCHIHAPLVLPVQVVPTALLEMSRSVMRERFSSLVTKPIYTFVFEREVPVTQVGRGGARVQDPLLGAWIQDPVRAWGPGSSAWGVDSGSC